MSYLTTDHLNSPRVITNENGVVTTRKDYTAFGEVSYTAERTAGLGYSGAEETRKGYTGYEKDGESGLDFAQARYYNSVHGRFTSVDPLTASITIRNPQTFNRYSYVLNSPYKYADPMGLSEECRTCSVSEMTTRSIDEHRAKEEERRKKEEEERRKRQQATTPQPPSDPRLEVSQIEVFVDKDPDETDPDSRTDLKNMNSTDPRTGNVVVDVPPFTGTPTVYVVATLALDGEGTIVESEPRGSGSSEPMRTGVESNTRQTPEGPTAPRGRRWDLVESTKLNDRSGNPQNQRLTIAPDGKSALITFAVQLLGPDFSKNNSFTITAYSVSNQVFGPNGKLNQRKVTRVQKTIEFRVKYPELRLRP